MGMLALEQLEEGVLIAVADGFVGDLAVAKDEERGDGRDLKLLCKLGYT